MEKRSQCYTRLNFVERRWYMYTVYTFTLYCQYNVFTSLNNLIFATFLINNAKERDETFDLFGIWLFSSIFKLSIFRIYMYIVNVRCSYHNFDVYILNEFRVSFPNYILLDLRNILIIITRFKQMNLQQCAFRYRIFRLKVKSLFLWNLTL